MIDAALCHIVRSKDQLVEGQTWIGIGLKRILIFVLTISVKGKSTVHWISGGNYFELFTHHLVNHAKKISAPLSNYHYITVVPDT